MSFLTCFWLFPQKEHLSRSPPSPIRATRTSPSFARGRSGPVSTTVQPSEPRGSPLTPRRPIQRDRSPDRYRNGGSGRADREPRCLSGLDHFVDESVVDRVLRGQDLVALDVYTDLVLGPAGVAGEERLQQGAHPQDLARLDLDVAALSVAALGRRLVDD